jgi:hypothetical protein
VVAVRVADQGNRDRLREALDTLALPDQLRPRSDQYKGRQESCWVKGIALP